MSKVFHEDAVYAPAPQIMTGKEFGKIDHTELTWLAGSSFLLNVRGTIILIDPLLVLDKDNDNFVEIGKEILQELPLLMDRVPKADVVCYTHTDSDHTAPETAKELAKLNAEMLGSPPVFEILARLGINLDLLKMVRTGDVYKYGDAKIEIIPGDHPWQLLDTKKFGARPFRYGDCLGFKVSTPDGVFVFPGDTRLMEEHLHLGHVDVLCVDVSYCTYHMTTEGATNLANVYEDAILIPFHYGTFYSPIHHPAHMGEPESVFKNVTNRQRARTPAPGQVKKFYKGKEID